MFKQMKNIDTAFKHIKAFSIFLILANVATTCFFIYKTDQRIEKEQNRVLILLNGKVLEAVASDRKDNVIVEAKDHVKTFHELFFSLDPDDKVIQANVAKALYLADASAKKEYDNLRENGYYSGIISGNISQRIQVDSVRVNSNEYPYAFRCYASQSIIRTTSTVSRSLITVGFLRNVSRSDNNPHGFLIERWATLENKDLKIENR